MKVARHSKRLLAAMMASAITVVDVHAAVTDIYNQPLATTSTVVAKPNIMFILDNSGSMADANMPDEMDNTGRYVLDIHVQPPPETTARIESPILRPMTG